MTEFIGARISLISKSNIRYVGTLHEINSETSTVALEQVTSHGTEGRRGGDGEIAGSENVYEYIVFRGSDVKDLRIEEPAQKKPQIPPPQLDDPAILGQSSTRPYPQAPGQFQQPPSMGAPPYYNYAPPQQQRGFVPGPMGYPPPPAPAGMFGPYHPGPGGPPPMGMPGPGMPPQQQPSQVPQQQHQQHQQASPQGQQQGQQPPQPAPHGQAQQPPTGPQNRAPPQAPAGPAANRQASGGRQPQASSTSIQAQKQQEHSTVSAANGPAPVQQKADTISSAPKVEDQAGAAGPVPVVQTPTKTPTGPKARGGIVPALPLTSPGRTPGVPVSNAAAPSVPTVKSDTLSNASVGLKDLADRVNQLAVSTAAETAAKSKPEQAGSVPATALPSQPRSRQQPGAGNFGAASRGRGGSFSNRGNFNNSQPNRKVEVPATDYDFQTNNEKFNKQDLVKEAIASGTEENIPHVALKSPEVAPAQHSGDAAGDVVIPPPKDGFYNRQSSFFDNISCENKERAEAVPGERRGGAQFRSEEQKKNLETFGQGSVDGYSGGYRGNWRGRGRGRGGFRGRGFNYGNRTGFRPPQQTGLAGN